MNAKAKTSGSNEPKGQSTSKGSQLDIVFSGPLLIVPETDAGIVTRVEVFGPKNGHPMGAVFVPGVWFTDEELNAPDCENWPPNSSFSLLDPHSYTIEMQQAKSKKHTPFPASRIAAANHKVRPGRRMSADWDVALLVSGQLSNWSSHRLVAIREGMYGGSDAPTVDSVAVVHRFTYYAVTKADFQGASREAKAYLEANIAQGGTIIIQGEVPYQPSLLHERTALSSLAKLAGLDLHLLQSAPQPTNAQLMLHTGPICTISVVVTDPAS
jgi:hypothetical protein